MASSIPHLALRALEFLWTLLVMALVGNIIADAFAGNPAVINYCMVVAVFSMACLFYFFAIGFNDSFTIHSALPLALDTLNVLLFFCAAVALAAQLGVHSCSNEKYTKSNHITNGSSDPKKRCQEAQATTAFLWFGFASYVVSLVFSIFGARSGGVNLRAGGIRKGAPSMSQV